MDSGDWVERNQEQKALKIAVNALMKALDLAKANVMGESMADDLAGALNEIDTVVGNIDWVK